jgi:hypothetical protein
MITEQTTLDELFDLAKASTNDVVSDEIFIVKDLFRGFEWNRIHKGNRTKLGSMYFAYAKNEGKNEIDPLGKTPQNQQMYQKR